MNDKNFVNFHVLISHSPSCLNRDDMNMQKSALFGGKRRVRISSQSLKRAMRTSAYYAQHLGEPSTRTKNLTKLRDKFTTALADRYTPELVCMAIEWLSGKSGLADDSKADAVAPWAAAELAYFCEQIKAGEARGLDAGALQKQIEKDGTAFRQALGQSVDIALSGRMATSGLMSEVGKVDGAMAIAHTITTHAVDADIDWFTAVDDLIAESGEMGAGHLDTQEFSSGVFYRYASLNLGQLQANLGGANRERALNIARHVLHMLATVVPSAKQQSFAAHNLADFALVSFSDLPVSLANAFEQPVAADRSGGYLKSSIEALAEYWSKVHKGYGLEETAKTFSLSEVEIPPDLSTAASLQTLEAWIAGDGEG